MVKVDNITIVGYKIISKIAKGGMASVYLAENQDKKPPKVAVKILDEFLEEEVEQVNRFKREAYICSKITHPNIVKVFKYGTVGKSQYILMEYVDGRDLGYYIKKKKKFSIKEIVNIILMVCSGLNEAHKRGVIHRDIKPQNIMLSGNNIAKITDFGIAKVRSMDNLTIVGDKVMGTTLYMSPEQISGKVSIDHRTDIYSLGIVLYELITGENPYIATAPNGPYATMNEILYKTPSPIRKRGIPGYLISVINKCISKDREDRFRNVVSLMNAIKNREQPVVKIRGDVFLIQVGTDKAINISLSETFIGREGLNNVILEDGHVSKRHARLKIVGNNYYLEDLGSMNGTYVNNERISDCLLSNGDMIRIGRSIFYFRKNN